MNDTNKKLKPDKTSSDKKSAAPAPPEMNAEDLAAKVPLLQEKWNEVIAELENESFADMTAALNRLVERAMESIGIEGDESLKQTIVASMETDPGLSQSLRSALNIKE
ncbi:MAG: hypothetical protein R3A13_04770 [Bdellovibrionota bacterium]